ncbi:cytochrome P450 [Amycolatopsis cihanbeyliensis]|uniref:cytochrome P450 n=1 Tax=Amycolatopsis cihanbeyliensis TaxID=1128664 RepID=UPI001B861B40|nr:cytochrome P450 [Amycolatopsis cihanbeyliensis]
MTRYDDVREALAMPQLGRDIGKLYRSLGKQIGRDLVPPALISNQLANSDPPRHTALRKALTFAFTPKRIEKLRPTFQKIIDDLLDDLSRQEHPDIQTALADPLPVISLAQLMGVPSADWPKFSSWAKTLQNTDAADPTGKREKDINDASVYVSDLIAKREREPEDDLISAMVHADEDKRLEPKEILSTVFAMMTGGTDTTSAMVTSCLLALLTHPEQSKRLAEDLDLIPDAIDELIRYVNPVFNALQRITLEPIEINGVHIPADEIVVISLGSANQDPTQFPDRPDELDITKPRPRQHLGFGHGVHFCVGSHMARALAEIALRRIFERFPDIRPAVDPSELRYRPSLLLRQLNSLPVLL